MLVNRGTIEQLSLNQVSLEAAEGPARGVLVRNYGKIQNQSFLQGDSFLLKKTDFCEEPTNSIIFR
jgi:hypothetical protein